MMNPILELLDLLKKAPIKHYTFSISNFGYGLVIWETEIDADDIIYCESHAKDLTKAIEFVKAYSLENGVCE
jgi:hypothetical protein